MSVEHGSRLDPSPIPLAALEAWMTERGLGDGELEGVERLAGGSQNVLLRFRRGNREFVLRRGPQHLRPESNRVIAREGRVLAALDATDVPHPHLFAVCDDDTVLDGAVFYLMEPIDGFNPAVELPALHAGSPEIRHAMGLAAVEALARLGAVDHRQVGLSDFGRPEGFLERQVPRWLDHLAAYERFAGYEPEQLPGVEAIATWLVERLPTTWTPGILHGDFHLGNLLFERAGPGVAAIVDWEMCTIGDPLLDLGLLLASWPTPGGATPLSGVLGAAGALPTDRRARPPLRRTFDARPLRARLVRRARVLQDRHRRRGNPRACVCRACSEGHG